MHPAGKNFKAVVTDHGITKAGTGSEQIAIAFQTEHGAITGFFSLAGKAAEHSMKKLLEAGFKGESLSELNVPAEEDPGFRGSECYISVDHELNPKTNELVAKVGWVNKTPGGVKKDTFAGVTASKKYDALLKKALKENPPESDGKQPWDSK